MSKINNKNDYALKTLSFLLDAGLCLGRRYFLAIQHSQPRHRLGSVGFHFPKGGSCDRVRGLDLSQLKSRSKHLESRLVEETGGMEFVGLSPLCRLG